jgi:hypothetical protein
MDIYYNKTVDLLFRLIGSITFCSNVLSKEWLRLTLDIPNTNPGVQ